MSILTQSRPSLRQGTVVRVARPSISLPEVGTLGTVLSIQQTEIGVQWAPDYRSMISYGFFHTGQVTVFQP